MRKTLLTTFASLSAIALLGTTIATSAEAAPRKASTATKRAKPAEDPMKDDPMKGVADSQRAWQNPDANLGPGQTAPGYSRHEFNPDQIIRLNLREAMNTTVRFPSDETIEDLYVSDPVSFEGIIPRSNVILLRVKIPGADGTVTAMGSSGNLYQFYVKGQPAKAPMITDITVDVIVTRKSMARSNTMPSAGGQSRNASASDLKVEADWLRSIGFRPENIVHDLSIYAPRGEEAGVAPERVFRDGQYTYIDYGANADAINEWPVASLIVQGVETPVNARTAGPNGRMLVIEAIGDIVLRNGNRIICIKQNGKLNRNPAAPAGATNVAIKNAASASVLPPAANSPSSGKRFSIDLDVGAPSTMAAQWQTLRTAHPREFASTDAAYPPANDRVGLSVFMPQPGEVKLRVGPFYNLADAIRACRAVTDTNKRCTVVNQTPAQ